MTDSQLLHLALAYDADPEDVRQQVAEWLRGINEFAAGLAAQLTRREPRAPIYYAARPTA
jgi:hypothetical protein